MPPPVPPRRSPPGTGPLGDDERERLRALLDALPGAPDLSSLDGFLVGVLLQPKPVPEARWLPFVHDLDRGGPIPIDPKSDALHALVRRRHAEIGAAIAARRWFDPWVFDLEPEHPGEPVRPSDVVLPWIAGWAAALERFPALLEQAGPAAREPLACLFANFDADDLEEVDSELGALIEEIEPPGTIAEAVEDLVRCTLLLADEMSPRRPRR
jgi:uncharacterized protein